VRGYVVAKSLNSRERIVTALEHKEPDRVPLDLGGGAATGLVGSAHNKLLAYLGFSGETKIWFPYVQWCIVDEKILERFDIDCINVVPMPEKWRRDSFEDGSPFLVPYSFIPRIEQDGTKFDIYKGIPIGKMPPGGNWYDPMYFPLAEASIEDLDGFSWMPPFSFYRLPDVDQLDYLVDGVHDTAKYWYENSDKALVGFAGASIYETAQGLRGYETLFTDFVLNQKFLEKMLDKIADANVEYAKRYCEAIADYAQVIVVGGEDIGAQGMLQIKPELYRQMVIPRIKRLWQTFKNNTDAYLYVHSCGYIEPIIDDFIDAGIDIINPVQVGSGMDPRKLKEEYGSRVTFWGGGIDTQHTLTNGSVEDVREEVKERINIFAPGGGYVFAGEQTIQTEVPPENVVAMYDAAKEFGSYPVIKSL
jgi:uroporphyrinogen decarboxylase